MFPHVDPAASPRPVDTKPAPAGLSGWPYGLTSPDLRRTGHLPVIPSHPTQVTHMIYIGRQGARGDALREIARLEQLTADLEVLARGELPLPEQLVEAPLLEAYRLGTRSETCLIGQCTDHPQLDGPNIFTSGLWVFAPRLGFARTLSRYYRLGCPAEGGGV